MAIIALIATMSIDGLKDVAVVQETVMASFNELGLSTCPGTREFIIRRDNFIRLFFYGTQTVKILELAFFSKHEAHLS